MNTDHEFPNIQSFAEYVDDQERIFLREGLEKSFPLDMLKSRLWKSLGKRVYMQPDATGFSLNVRIEGTLTVEERRKLQQVMDLCGYHVGRLEAWGVRLEPKHPILMSREELPELAYHATPDYNVDRIQRIGLMPRDSRTTFKHPGNRIYLFVAEDPRDAVALKLSIKKNIEKQLESAGREIPLGGLHMKVFKVRLTEPLYCMDPNVRKGNFSATSFSIFTFKNISPNYIEVTDL